MMQVGAAVPCDEARGGPGACCRAALRNHRPPTLAGTPSLLRASGLRIQTPGFALEIHSDNELSWT